VVDRYDFGSAARIVDVGGGIGSLLASIMKLYPDARGTLFDQAHVVSEGRRHMSAAGVADRCDYVGGDFLGSVPRGGDVYIISSVLMSLTDEQAMKLLKNCRAAIAPGGRLLVIEPLLGGRNQPGFGKIMDVMMLVETHGRVRSEEAFRALFSAAGFELSRIIPTNAMAMCLLEGIPNEDTGAFHDRTAIAP
jgi:SAM-dependent methyltransferase